MKQLEARRVAVDHAMEQIRSQRKAFLNAHGTQPQFPGHRYREGDLVLIYAPLKQQPKGLRLPWVGPFRVTKITSSTIVQVNAPTSRLRRGLVHVSRLKPYRGALQPP
jgi:hypothetical protein